MDPRDLRPQDRLLPKKVRAKTLQGPRTPCTELKAHLMNSIESFHPLGKRVKVVGPVRQPPAPQPQPHPRVPPRVPKPLPVAPRRSVVPAASKPPAGHKQEVAPAAASSSKACTGPAAQPKQPGWLRRSPTGGQTAQERLPQQLRMPPPPPLPRLPATSPPLIRPSRYLVAKPTPLEEQEVSVPITPQQRPERERMKKLAQEERQRAARQMSIGEVQFLVQREIDMGIADAYGYP